MAISSGRCSRGTLSRNCSRIARRSGSSDGSATGMVDSSTHLARASPAKQLTLGGQGCQPVTNDAKVRAGGGTMPAHLDHLILMVNDRDQSIDFYTRIL